MQDTLDASLGGTRTDPRIDVGRLSLNFSTLRVFPDRPGTFISAPICWPTEVEANNAENRQATAA